MFNWFAKKDGEHQQSENTRAMPTDGTTTKEFKLKRVSKPVEALLRGDRSLGLSVPSKTIRVFISSTFTDFQPERDRAMEVVYPKLRASAKAQFGLTFDIVDMRWGVLDVSTDNHATAELCLQELETCFEDSAGPAMVCLAGDRYGYRPAPVVIKAKEFEEVLGQIKPNERSFYSIEKDKPSDPYYRLSDKELLTAAYALNENAVPAEFVLQPISFFYPGFKRTRVEVKYANDRFWHVETRIRKILQQASARSKKLTEEEKRKYIISVTEDEVMTGLRLQEKLRKKDPNAPSKIIVYSRTFGNLDVDTEKTKPKFSKFNDVCKDPEAEELLRSMQKRLVAAVPKSKSTQFALKAPWKQDTPDGNGFGLYNDTTPEGQAYIDRFCEAYFDILWKLIQDHVKYTMSKRQYPAVDAGVVEEVLLHRDIMDENYKNFAGRAQDLENFKSFVKFENKTVIKEDTGEETACGRIATLTGRSGTGKTALVSAGIAQIASEHPDLVVVYRFVGTTSRSGSIRDLLVSICLQIIRVYRDEKSLSTELKDRISEIKIKLESATPYSFAELSEYFWDCLSLPSATSRPLLLIIDNPDGLSAADDPLGFSWLPETAEEIPADVKILLVMDPYLEGHDRLVYSKYQDYRGDYVDSLSIDDLSSDDVDLVVEKYLSGLWLSSTKRAPARKLQPEQRYELFQHCNKTPRPLYIRMAIDIARRVTSSTDRNETDVLLKDTMPDMINALFESLERSHGKMFVSHALGAITAAEYGLSWTELEDLISCDDFVLNQVYEWWTPSVRRIPPLLWIRVRNALVPFLTEKGVDGVEVYSWYNKEFEVVARARYLCQPAPKGITRAVILADDEGDQVYTGTTRGEVTWYESGLPTAKRNLEHSSDISAITRMELGGETWIISGSSDYTVRIWNPRSGKVISLFHYAPEEEGVDSTLVAVTAVGWAISAANEALIFSGTCMGHLYVWNFADVIDVSESSEAVQVIDVGAVEEADEGGFKPIDSICLTGTGKGLCAVTHQGTLCRVDLYPNEPGAGLAYKICPSGVVRPFTSWICPARDWEEAVFIGTIDNVLKYDFESGELTGVLGGSPWATFVNPELTEAPGEEDDEWDEAGALEAATHGRVRAMKLVADGRLCVVFSNRTIAFVDLAAKTATWYDGAFEGATFESADIAWGGDFIVAGYNIPAVDKSGVILTVFTEDGETHFLEMEATSETLEQTDNAIADLFIGKWATDPKPIDAPFSSKGDLAKSRDVTPKPRFVEKHGPFRDEQKSFPDLRHITNAPKHLIRAGRLEEAAAILIDKQFNAAANAAGSVYVRVVENHMKDLAAAYALAKDEEGYKMWRLEQQDRAARALELEEDPLAANLCIGASAGWADISAQEIFAFPNAFADVGRAVVAVTSSVYARGFDSIVGMVTLFVVNTQERWVNKLTVIPEGVNDEWSTEDAEVMDSMPGIVDELCVDNDMKFIYTFEQKTLADGTDLAILRKRSLESQETVATRILATGEDAHKIEINKLTIKEIEGKTVLTEETRVEEQVEKGFNLVTVQTNWVWDIDTLEVIMAPDLSAQNEEGGEEEQAAKDDPQEDAGENEDGEEEGDGEYDEDAEYEDQEEEEGAKVTSWDSARFFAADFNGRILIWENKKHTMEEIVAMAKEEAGDQDVPEYEEGGQGLDQMVYERGELLGQMRAHVEEAKFLQYTEVGDTKILLSVNATNVNPHIPWVLKAFDVTRYWESS